MKSSYLVILAATAVWLTGCSHVDLRGGGMLPEEEKRYTTFFTPTHEFQCFWVPGDQVTVDLVPGDRYGAGDVSNYPYSIHHTFTSDDGTLPNNTVALRMTNSEKWGLYHAFFIIAPTGHFIMKDSPDAFLFDGDTHVSFGKHYRCTNKSGLPAFKQLTTSEGGRT